jgi:hypothetical protein
MQYLMVYALGYMGQRHTTSINIESACIVASTSLIVFDVVGAEQAPYATYFEVCQMPLRRCMCFAISHERGIVEWILQ